MKKRFLFLKNPIRLHDPCQIDRLVVTCAVLHNLLLDHDGVDDLEEDEVEVEYNGLEEVGNRVARERSQYNGVSGARSRHRDDLYDVDSEDEGYQYTNDTEERAEFVSRREQLIEHYIYLREEAG